MKAGHYYAWAKKSFAILDKFHTKMYELWEGSNETEHWDDDLNCRHHDLERALEDDNYDRTGYWKQGYFYKLEAQDTFIKNCEWKIDSYKDQIRDLQRRIRNEKSLKSKHQEERLKMIQDFDMDYKTIEQRLKTTYPEYAEGV